VTPFRLWREEVGEIAVAVGGANNLGRVIK